MDLLIRGNDFDMPQHAKWLPVAGILYKYTSRRRTAQAFAGVCFRRGKDGCCDRSGREEKIAKILTELGYEVLTGRQVCLEEAWIGVPSGEVLEEHARLALAQGAPEEYLTGEMRQGFTGVIGILRCGPGPVAALRFDIDALGLHEEQQEKHRPYAEGFSSRNPGMMHACGHDGHAAIGLGTAEVLMKLKDRLHGTVKLIAGGGIKQYAFSTL